MVWNLQHVGWLLPFYLVIGPVAQAANVERLDCPGSSPLVQGVRFPQSQAAAWAGAAYAALRDIFDSCG